jgi:signal transduction histidine kinase
MSDININLDGVIAFIAAIALGLLLVLGILAISLFSLIRARRSHGSFSRQLLFPQVIGMLVSLFGCLIVAIILIAAESMTPPRALNIWLDQWVWVWLIAVLALWPASAFAWKAWRELEKGR